MSDTSHNEYLTKLREMLSREDVQQVMMEEAKQEEERKLERVNKERAAVVEDVEQIKKSGA